MTLLPLIAIAITAGLAGVILGKKDWPPIPWIRTIRHRIFAQPSSDRFKIRVAFGDSPIDVQAFDSTTAVTIGPTLVDDFTAVLVADPFLHAHADRAWLFFEALDSHDRKGVIGAASSTDGRDWTYEGTVLSEDFHLSYPMVLHWDDRHWMIPETNEDNSVRIYESSGSLTEWKLHSKLLHGLPFADATPFEKDGRWYMFVTIDKILALYHAESLLGPWLIHPSSPVKPASDDCFRCGGRVRHFDASLIRMAQIARPYYGRGLDRIHITQIDENSFAEVRVGALLRPDRSSDWRPFGTHHLEAASFQGRWLLCADGF